MQYGPNNVSIDEVLCGDMYRSVTSGGVVSVVPRRGQAEYLPFWQINTWTGTSSLGYRNDRIKTVAQCRSVARGGLLCDDPGLGKTISILSLILQTFGQSTERLKQKERSKVSDDLIIDSYWREILVSSTRRDELLELTLKLRKCDQAQIFQYPVEDVLTDEEMAAYKELVKDPIW